MTFIMTECEHGTSLALNAAYVTLFACGHFCYVSVANAGKCCRCLEGLFEERERRCGLCL